MMATSSSPAAGTSQKNVIELNDNKAGMAGIDKARISQIIEEASRGSKFYQRQQAKKATDAKRAEETRRRIEALSSDALAAGERAGDAEIRRAMSGADFSRTHVHIDMDAFYAAVEMLDNPKLRHVPMAVGGNDMLSTSNYAARRFGVRAAMPGFIAKKLCPQLVIVPCRFDRYKELSRQVQAVLADYDAHFSAASLDEAYLDITEHLATGQAVNILPGPKITCQCSAEVAIGANSNSDYKSQNSNKDANAEADVIIKSSAANTGVEDESTDPTAGSDERNRVCPNCYQAALPGRRQFGAGAIEAVAELRYRVFLATGLTASAGIGPNSMLAKIGSDFNKPNGQYRVAGSADRVLEFIRQLPVRKVPGIGRVAEAWLASLGVANCRDLYERRGALYHACRPLTFQFYMRACVGVGGGFGYGRSDQSDQSAASANSEADSDRKSVSVERTFQATDNLAWLLEEKLPELCDSLVHHLKQSGFVGRTVTIKLKLDSFEVLTRSHGLPSPTDSVDVIRSAAASLLRQEFASTGASARPPPRIRLLGVRLSTLSTPRHSSSTGLGGGCGSGTKQARLDELLLSTSKSATKTSSDSVGLVDPAIDSVKSSSTGALSTEAPTASSSSTDASNEEADKEANLSCPVCSAPQPGGLAGLNRHLDFCLSRSAIQTAVSHFSNSESASSSSSRKRADNQPPMKSAANASNKRAKIASGRSPTIDSYFAKPKTG